ncbi:GMC oxidoreductase [Pseudozobellia thermophila]|uniref:Choline dehydrogenase n=1 Tax=Pseudozobellia thermophila TaxID=192903 RepID=A0A1M6NLD4_9FLAO|nr:GMC family oxidoreductase [Pseudozobellia thermophila]SHJ96446.1 Choline dehydrogenase [Pseudozobellia thermophila]
MKNNTYDAIVVGSGITGGWAAKELTEKGLKTLVLERGRHVEHQKDYNNTYKAPWDYKYLGAVSKEDKKDYFIQSKKYNFNAGSKPFFVKDTEHPYTHPENKPYRWFRGYQTGGRSLIWGRGAYRFSDLDFEANLKDGVGVDWPIRYKDIAPWYDYVEKFIGVCGSVENISHFPDGQFLPPFELNRAEKVIKERLESHYGDRKLIPNRAAHLTEVKPGQFKGRSKCMSRNMCHTGCPFGAYFSSNSSTLPAARDTGRLTLKSNAIVTSLIYDEKTNRVYGVRVIDGVTKQETEYFARVVFLCASTLATTGILLNSKSNSFPNGLGNSSGVLGHYLMDHHKNITSSGILEGYLDRTYKGYRPTSVAIPRFRNLGNTDMDFIRGYGMWGSAQREGVNPNKEGVGADFKKSLTLPGPWKMSLSAYGECLPYFDNKVELDEERTDQWGLPLLKISAEFRDNEMKMRKDMKAQAKEVLEVAGLKEVEVHEGPSIHGDSVHEMGTARMGRDPKTSFLNGYNQSHDIPNLFVTDGSCMASSSYMSPSLTYMALTARACDYAVRQMKDKVF